MNTLENQPKGKLIINKRSRVSNVDGSIQTMIQDAIAGEREMTAKRIAHNDKLREQIKADKERKAGTIKDGEGKNVLVIHKRSYARDEYGNRINP